MNTISNSYHVIASGFGFISHFSSFGLIIFLIATFAELVIAVAVLRSNMKSATGIIFFFLSLATICWMFLFYIGSLSQFFLDAVIISRLGIFFAAPMSSLFFLLAHTLPSSNLQLKRVYFWLVMVATALMMVLNLSPYAFTAATNVTNGNINPVPSWGFAPFAILSTLFSVLAIFILIKKFIKSSGAVRQQIRLVLLGMMTMLVLIIATILVPILVFHSAAFLILTPVYTLIFLGTTAYAIVKYGLFNIKIIATEALTFVILITLFARIFVATGVSEIVIDIGMFDVMVILGIILIRSVRKEVEQREELERLNKQIADKNVELESLSRFKSQLLSLASHQIKSPLAAIKGFVSLIADGSYGVITDNTKTALGKIQRSADDLIALINTLLDLRKVDEGKMEYKMAPTDLNKLTGDVIDLLKPLAATKQLELSFTSRGQEVWANADAEKLRQVIQNLIDNAIKYTPSGYVRVELKEDASAAAGQTGIATISVTDSGLGIPADLIPHLFEEFVRDERVKKEILGTGLGLYIASKIAQAHGGKITAESPGEGKGSTFRLAVPEIKPDEKTLQAMKDAAAAAATSAVPPAVPTPQNTVK